MLGRPATKPGDMPGDTSWERHRPILATLAARSLLDAAIDKYVSTTAIIISRGPTLVRKAVLEQTLRGVKDVLWRT